VNYYERHLGDYARDTAHLSMVEHGAYTLLLDRYYATEKGIPADQVHRLARARSVDEREAVDVVLGEFFKLVDGLWVHNRVEEEIEKAAVRIGAARENGRKGGRPKKEETQQKPNGFSSGYENVTQQEPSEKLTKLHTPDTIKSEREMPASTPAGDAGRALRSAGCSTLNLTNPDFLAALGEGVTPDEFGAAANEAGDRGISPGARFTYAVKVARSNHAKVASPIEPNSRAGPTAAAPQSRTQLASQNIWDTVNAITQRNSELDSSGNRLGPGQAPVAQLGRTSGS
jgi:uncharacterized protein YdaU (DUF1376 family)